MTQGRLPTFLVIGAMKAGTSSFHQYLKHHPDIFMSEGKELNFFMTTLNYDKGIEWYKSQFITDKKECGETSPNYSKYEVTAELIHKHLPNIKLIYIVRDPVDRFLSECRHMNLDPNETITKNLNSDRIDPILEAGKYYLQLKRYLEYFSLENIHIIDFFELINNPDQEMKAVSKFLGVSEKCEFPKNFEKEHISAEKIRPKKMANKLQRVNFYNFLKNNIYNNFSDTSLGISLKHYYKKIMYNKTKNYSITEENKNILRTYYTEDVKSLRHLTDKKFDSWKI